MFESMEEIEKNIAGCQKCELCKHRNNIVIGEGNLNADLMFIGEGPGAEEDKEGRPFVGKAGILMNNAFTGLGIKREDCYITNVVKCRPDNNRNPKTEEADACKDYLRSQVMIIKPKIIVLLGSVALKNIIDESLSITRARGKWIEVKGIKYMPTYHPAALLRDEAKKIDFWNDLKLVLEELKKS